MKTKKDKSSRQSRKTRLLNPEGVESNEKFIDLKNYVDGMNRDTDIYYFDCKVLQNGRFVDKPAEDPAKDLKIEEPPFTDQPVSLQTEECSREGKIEINLGIGFDKSVQFIESLRIEDAQMCNGPLLSSYFAICSKYNTISKLYLIECGLKADSIEIIAEQLKSDNNTIKDLSLDWNVVPEQNYHLLIDETTLEHLSLRHCKIDCKGIKLISQALEFKQPQIKQRLLSLVLNGNDIRDSGLFYLVMALRTNFKLHYLSLSYNSITDSGVEMIAGVLKKFPISPEEDKERRFLFIKYLESAAKDHGKECIDSIYNAVDKFSSVHPQRSGSSSSELENNRKSISDKKKSQEDSILKNNTSDGTRNQDTILKISNSFISTANIMNGDLHPLLTTVYKEGDIKYCVGNFALAFLNLSYNCFGRIGLHALIEAAKYQSNVEDQVNGFGLMGIKAEGLKSGEEVDEEIEELNNILRKRSLPKLYDRRHLIYQLQNVEEKSTR